MVAWLYIRSAEYMEDKILETETLSSIFRYSDPHCPHEFLF